MLKHPAIDTGTVPEYQVETELSKRDIVGYVHIWQKDTLGTLRKKEI